MTTEVAPSRALGRLLRVDSRAGAGLKTLGTPSPYLLMNVAIAITFVIYAGNAASPGDAEARLGMAAGESFAPMGQVFGGWDAALAPGQVWISQAWAAVAGLGDGVGAIRWPSLLAALAIGAIVVRRLSLILGERAGTIAAMVVWGSLGMIDRSASLGVDALSGLAVVGAIDRLLSKGSDWVSGWWASAAFLLGDWPALALILLPAVVLGRSGAAISARLILPPIATFAAWSTWACKVSGAEVWAASQTWPLTQPNSWSQAAWVLAAGLPWSPFAMLVAWPGVRQGLGNPAWTYVKGWLQTVGVIVIAATVLPGLGLVGTVPAMIGVAVVASSCLDHLWSSATGRGQTRVAIVLALTSTLVWAAVSINAGAYLAAAQPYYRGVAFLLIILGLIAGMMGLDSAWTWSARGAIRAVFVVAVGIKLAHSGIYQPERNYRFSKGPWGRAVGQYVPEGWPIYTFHGISPALALATEHPVRQLRNEFYLKGLPGDYARFVLLTGSEFDAWPVDVPKILKVRTFEDEYGGVRVLARTEGKIHRRPEE